MGLESGTYIHDLNTANPVDSDQKSQGAAHLRLVKSVLKTTLPFGSLGNGVLYANGGAAALSIASSAQLASAIGSGQTATLGALPAAGGQLTGALLFKSGLNNVASSATVNLTAVGSNQAHITGTTGISAFTMTSGQAIDLVFDGVLTLTHHATNNNLPSGANITTAANDRARYWYDGTTVWCLKYQKADGTALVAPAVPAQTLVQTVEATPVTSVVTCSAVTPHDDTIPQNTEGTQIITATITPTNSSNRLRIEFNAPSVGTASTAQVTTALFQDSSANALAVGYALPSGNAAAPSALVHEMAAGTTSATTFKIRIGVASGTAYVNGNYSGTRVYGGVSAARLRISELKP